MTRAAWRKKELLPLRAVLLGSFVVVVVATAGLYAHESPERTARQNYGVSVDARNINIEVTTTFLQGVNWSELSPGTRKVTSLSRPGSIQSSWLNRTEATSSCRWTANRYLSTDSIGRSSSLPARKNLRDPAS